MNLVVHTEAGTEDFIPLQGPKINFRRLKAIRISANFFKMYKTISIMTSRKDYSRDPGHRIPVTYFNIHMYIKEL